ncbi:MAG TPA: orotidine-5'-phosphate decarboxylase [Actinomycetota bacterium]
MVALDRPDLDGAEALAASLAGAVGLLKVGLELFVSNGPDAVRRIRAHAPVFLDLKLHDIPNTVGRAARAAGSLGPDLLTVHALGGEPMVRSAVEGAATGASASGFDPPRIVAVTVLSSVGGESLASPASLAFEAVSAGAAGVVVSGEDVREVREALGDGPIVVVPGVRPAGFGSNDHVRVLTPRDALAAGADHLVVGRPITEASDPAGAARMVLAEIG